MNQLEIDIVRMKQSINHRVNDQFCEDCQQDSVTCQRCGKIVCGYSVHWVESVNQGRASNVCVHCLTHA